MDQISQILEGFADKPGDFPLQILLLFSLLAGLVSSISPCVLSLLPLNLAYIGTRDIDNKLEALAKAFQFVLGVSLVMGLMGAFSSFAFIVFTAYKAVIFTIVGIFILIMSLVILEIIKLPLPNLVKEMPVANPFVVGLLFALVSSPCSSPVLFSVLSASASLGSIAKSVAMMFVYSFGYTFIIFLASVFAGLIKQLDYFKSHSKLVNKISAAILAVMGIIYLVQGLGAL